MTGVGRINLRSLKLPALRRLTGACGVMSSRTKESIVTGLPHELTSALDFTQKSRLLSIDMGVRNLAYCALSFDPSKLSGMATSQIMAHITSPGDSTIMDRLDVLPAVQIEAWERIDLTSTDISPLSSFSPSAMAPIAYRLVAETFLPLQPDCILIERQRHRTGGMGPVQEWTFRVNILESMLWMTLETMRQQQPLDTTFPMTHAVLPRRVNSLLLESDRECKESKSLKIEIARNLVQSDSLACGTRSASRTRDAFLSKVTKSTTLEQKQRTETEAAVAQGQDASRRKMTNTLQKLDDLADSLLQGLAWVQWEANKRAVLQSLDKGG